MNKIKKNYTYFFHLCSRFGTDFLELVSPFADYDQLLTVSTHYNTGFDHR